MGGIPFLLSGLFREANSAFSAFGGAIIAGTDGIEDGVRMGEEVGVNTTAAVVMGVNSVSSCHGNET